MLGIFLVCHDKIFFIPDLASLTSSWLGGLLTCKVTVLLISGHCIMNLFCVFPVAIVGICGGLLLINNDLCLS